MTDVRENAEQHRYEILVDGDLAGFAEYRLEPADGGTSGPGRIVFTHTEIDDAFEGKGLGGQLAKGALDDVRTKGLGVVPLCPFIAGWIERHDDYADLVDQERYAQLRTS